MKHILFILTLVGLSLSASAAQGWDEYVNTRFGFKMSYPAGLASDADAPGGNAREYHNKGHEFRVIIAGYLLSNGDTLESMWKGELKDRGKTVTSKIKDSHHYLVSGVQDGRAYYHRIEVQNGRWAYLSITYPQAKAKQYDPWKDKIEKSFVPFLK